MIKNPGVVWLYLFFVAISCVSCTSEIRPETRDAKFAIQGGTDSSGGIISGMVFVKGGCFEMGDIFGDGHRIERPVHEDLRTSLQNFYSPGLRRPHFGLRLVRFAG